MRRIDEIIYHCSATPPDMDIGKAEIDRWHRQRGWLMGGYHFYIRRDGLIEEGRPLTMAGAHAKGHNAHSIGICLIGGVNKKQKPEDNFTDAQWNSLEALYRMLDHEYPGARHLGHRDLPKVNKACPSFDVQTKLKEIDRVPEDR